MQREALPILLLTFVNAIGGTLLIPVLPFVVRDLGQSDFVFCAADRRLPRCPVLRRSDPRQHGRPLRTAADPLDIAGGHTGELADLRRGLLRDRQRRFALTLLAASRIIDGLTGGNASVAAAYLADVHQLNLIAKARTLTGRETLYRLFGVQGMFTMAFSGYSTILTLWYVDRLGISEASVGLMMLAIGVFLIFNEMVTLPFVEKRLGDVGTLLLGLCLLPVALFFLRLPSTVVVFLPVAFIVNVGMALVLPTLQSVVTQAADESEEGRRASTPASRPSHRRSRRSLPVPRMRHLVVGPRS